MKDIWGRSRWSCYHSRLQNKDPQVQTWLRSIHFLGCKTTEHKSSMGTVSDISITLNNLKPEKISKIIRCVHALDIISLHTFRNLETINLLPIAQILVESKCN